MPQAAAPIGLATGGIGLLQDLMNSGRQNDLYNNAQDLQRQGLDMTRQIAAPQIGAENQMYANAQNYNPVNEAQAGVSRAKDIFKTSLGTALGNVASSFAQNGSMPGQNSEFNVRSQDVTNNVSSPFQSYLADALSNPTQQKANMWSSIIRSAPSGSLADNYFKGAGQDMSWMGALGGGSYGADLGNISKGLTGMFPGLGGMNSVPGRSG